MGRKLKLMQAPSGEIYTSESDLQKACVTRFRTMHADAAFFLFSIPNGARMGGLVTRKGFPVMASIMVGEGLTAGVFDLFLSIPASDYHGLYIEMKTPVGDVSKEQKQFAERMLSVGYACVICRRIADFEKVTSDYMEGKYRQEYPVK